MKQIILFLFLLAISVNSNAQVTPTWMWAKSDTTVQIQVNPSYLKQVVGARDNRVLWGRLQNKKYNYGSSTYGEYTLVEYDTLGVQRVSTSITGKVSLTSVQADSLGNWYVLGTVYDSIRFAGGQLYTVNIFANESMNFMCKLHTGTLALDWYQKIGVDYQTSVGLLTAQPRNLYLVTDSGLVGKVWRIDPLTGNRSLFVTQIHENRISSLQEDNLGNLYVAGSCASPFSGIDFNGTLGMPSSTNSYPDYVVRYKNNGQHDWHFWMTDITCVQRKLTLATNNLVYYSGALHDSMTLGSFFLKKPKWVYGFLLARMDSTGSIAWVRTLKDTLGGDASMEHTLSAVVSKDSSITIFPNARGYVDWGNGVISSSGISTHATCVNYAADGTPGWVRAIGGSTTYAQQIVSNGTDLYVTGIGTDSTNLRFDALTAPAKINYNAPYVARLFTGIVPKVTPPNGETPICTTAPIVMLQPNPAKDELNVFNLYWLKNRASITLTDMTGRTLIREERMPGEDVVKLNVGSLARGIYVLQVRGEDVRFATRVVLK